MIPKMSPNPDPEVPNPDSRILSHRPDQSRPRYRGSASSPTAPTSDARPPSNKNRSACPDPLTKMKESPPHREYAVFHAICCGERFTPFPFVTFNSIQKGKQSQTTCTSGTPPPCLFSIRVENVFGGRFFFTVVQKFFSNI